MKTRHQFSRFRFFFQIVFRFAGLSALKPRGCVENMKTSAGVRLFFYVRSPSMHLFVVVIDFIVIIIIAKFLSSLFFLSLLLL